jgi:CxxC motif-containing protein (DUF1111 family)
MKKLKLFYIITFTVCFSSCQKEEYINIYKPNSEIATDNELSAGQSTTFTFTSVAYDTPSDWATGDLYERFLRGDGLYDTPRHSGDGPYGGLGPLYCGYSCGSCHVNSGRTKSTLHTDGGSGSFGFSSFLTFIRTPNDQYYRDYGRVLHDQAVYGTVPEGKLKVAYSEKTYTFDDGESYSLITPTYWIEDFYTTSISSDDIELSVRTPLRHVGLGLMDAVNQDEIQALAAMQYPEYGISGKINWVTERGVLQMGLSGHKASHADLTVELGFSSDMGVTNDRYPDEVGAGQSQDTGTSTGIQVSTEDMADVDFYLHSLGVPARRMVDDPEVIRGEEMFYQAKCNLCHTPTLHTKPEGATLIDGTSMPWLGNQTIHPYSDYLLHDMGPELGDDYSQGLATGDEWRTTPLWGMGLQEVVNGHTDFLHDARARNYVEAIMWHGGEGDYSRQTFAGMPKEDRDALIQFLKTL